MVFFLAIGTAAKSSTDCCDVSLEMKLTLVHVCEDVRTSFHFLQSAMLSGTVFPMSTIDLRPVGDHFNILIWDSSVIIFLIWKL